MSTASFYILSLVCIVQVVIISHLLGRKSSIHLIQKGDGHSTVKEEALLSSKLASARLDSTGGSAVDSKPLEPSYNPLPLDISVSNASSRMRREADSETQLRGVAVFISTHHPTWFQRRYTLMVQNVKNNLPPGWKLQIFHFGSGQSKAGLDINNGLLRMIDRGEIIVTVIPESLLKRKRKMIELITEPWIWRNMAASRVFLFGGNAVICSNYSQRWRIPF